MPRTGLMNHLPEHRSIGAATFRLLSHRKHPGSISGDRQPGSMSQVATITQPTSVRSFALQRVSPSSAASLSCQLPAPRIGLIVHSLCSRRLCFPTARAQRRRAAIVMAAAAKTVLVPVADGSEEIETVTIVDVLRRAGADVTLASVEEGLQVECSRGVKLVADVKIGDVTSSKFDAIAIPGGMPGAERINASEPVRQLLAEQADGGRLVTAICAAPAVVLETQGLLKGKQATAHPAFLEQLSNGSETRVVVDGKTITSRGPGTAIEFSLSLIRALYGAEKAQEVAGPMVIADGLQY